MSREKQIEEMAWKLCDIPRHPNITSCEQCGIKHCHAMYYAERAYNAGYRKQVEGEWIVTKTEHSWNCGEYPSEYTCSVCGRTEPRPEPYCHCGAKMTGGGGDE